MYEYDIIKNKVCYWTTPLRTFLAFTTDNRISVTFSEIVLLPVHHQIKWYRVQPRIKITSKLSPCFKITSFAFLFSIFYARKLERHQLNQTTNLAFIHRSGLKRINCCDNYLRVADRWKNIHHAVMQLIEREEENAQRKAETPSDKKVSVAWSFLARTSSRMMTRSCWAEAACAASSFCVTVMNVICWRFASSFCTCCC